MEASELLLKQMIESLDKVGKAYSNVTECLKTIQRGGWTPEQSAELTRLIKEYDAVGTEWEYTRDKFLLEGGNRLN